MSGERPAPILPLAAVSALRHALLWAGLFDAGWTLLLGVFSRPPAGRLALLLVVALVQLGGFCALHFAASGPSGVFARLRPSRLIAGKRESEWAAAFCP